MIDKIGHVTNPLTIIAIFAGLAEVSGTIVFPLLNENIQSTYIWFLMLFPSVLVILFFFVLFFRREILYAPSDFREDASFIRLFRTPSKGKLEILDEEVKEEQEIENNVKQATPTGVTNPSPHTTSSLGLEKNDVRAISLLSEEFVLNKLSKEFQINFTQRNVSPFNNRNIYFDAVALANQRMYVVEIKMARYGILRPQVISLVFRQMASFFMTLNDSRRQQLIFIFAVVVLDKENNDAISSIEQNIKVESYKYPFETIVKVYNLKDLE